MVTRVNRPVAFLNIDVGVIIASPPRKAPVLDPQPLKRHGKLAGPRRRCKLIQPEIVGLREIIVWDINFAAAPPELFPPCALSCKKFAIARGLAFLDFTYEFDTSKPAGFPKRVMDISLEREVIGYNPMTALLEGLKETWGWFVENQDEYLNKKNYFLDD